MIYDAIEAVYTVVLANFASDMAALCAAKGVTCDTSINVIKRQSAEYFTNHGMTLPAVGVVGTDVRTQAKNQGSRDNESTIVLDYYCEGTGAPAVAVTIAKQTELAAEALLLSVDKVTPSGSGIYGAAELVGSVLVKFSEGFTEAKAGVSGRTYWRRAELTFPVHDRDTV